MKKLKVTALPRKPIDTDGLVAVLMDLARSLARDAKNQGTDHGDTSSQASERPERKS